MDISFDNRLIVTGSSDRHVKIWGMDFGDCHRSLYAHEDSIMSVQFVAKTHYFFTVGKDGKLKEWDADKFERIITLDVILYILNILTKKSKLNLKSIQGTFK